MRFKIVEKKNILSEQDQYSSITVSMFPSSFLMLTTDREAFSMIRKFILEGKHEEAKNIPKSKDRVLFILNRKTLPKEMPNWQRLGLALLEGGLLFLSPTEEHTKWGKFDEEKTKQLALQLSVKDDTAKVVDHDGRNRSVYYWMTNTEHVNVLMNFNINGIDTFSKIPEVFISELDGELKVYKQNLSPEKETGTTFKKVEGFINSLGVFPRQSILDDFNNKKIKVDNQDAVLLRTRGLNPPGSEYQFSGVFHIGLYPKSVLELEKGDDVILYLRNLEKYEFSPEQGPVTFGS